ncbi:unnamed protein product, partial [Didymodactylos carnosus]
MPFKGLSQVPTVVNVLELSTRELQKVELNVFIYDEETYSKHRYYNVNDVLAHIEANDTKCIWLEVNGAIQHRDDVLTQLALHFNLHLLTVEDIQTTQQRMKLDIFDDGIYLLMKMIYVEHEHKTNILEKHISIYLKDNLLLTFQEEHNQLFSQIKQRIANSRGRIKKLRTDYLFYCLVDTIIENYMIVLGTISITIEDIDAELMKMSTLKLDTLRLIYFIKHDMLHFRVLCSPLKEIIIKLQKTQDRL